MKRIYLYPDSGRATFTIGTHDDVRSAGIVLEEGMTLPFYCDDADDVGRPDDLFFDGVIHYDADRKQWSAIINVNSFRHASDEKPR